MKKDVEMSNTNEKKDLLKRLEKEQKELIQTREIEKEKVRKIKKDIFKGIQTEGESLENLLLNIDYYNQKINENEQKIKELNEELSTLEENDDFFEEDNRSDDSESKREENLKGKSKGAGKRRSIEVSSIFEEFDEISKNGQTNGKMLNSFKRKVQKILTQYRGSCEVIEQIKSIDEQIRKIEKELNEVDTELLSKKQELNVLKKARREEKKKVEVITDKAVEGIMTDTSQIENLALNIDYLNKKIDELPSKKRQLKAQIRKFEKQKNSLSQIKIIEENQEEYNKLSEIYSRVNSDEFKKKTKIVKKETTKKDNSEQNFSKKEKDRREFIKKVEQERKKASGIFEKEIKEKKEEEIKRKAEEDAKQKAAEESKRKAEEDAKQKAAEEAKRKAEEDAKQKATEEAKRKAEKDAKQKAAEESKRKAEEDKKSKAEKEVNLKNQEKINQEDKNVVEDEKSIVKSIFLVKLFQKIFAGIKLVVLKIKEKFFKNFNVKQNTYNVQNEHISTEDLWKIETMEKLRSRIISALDGKIDVPKYEFDQNIESIIDDEVGFLKNLYNGSFIPVDERKRVLCDVFKKVYKIKSYNESHFGNDLDEIYDKRKSRIIFKDIIKGKFDYRIQRYGKNVDFTGKKLSSDTRYLQKAIDMSMKSMVESAKKSRNSSNLIISKEYLPNFDKNRAKKLVSNLGKKIESLEDQKFLDQIKVYQLSYYFDNIDLKKAIEDIKSISLLELLKKISSGEYENDRKKKEDNIWRVPDYEWKRVQPRKTKERVIKSRVIGIG